MDETFQVLVHGENYVLRFIRSDIEDLPYDERYADDDASDEATELSHAEVVGFYTTVTLTVANPGQLRGAVLQKLIDRLRKNCVIPIRHTKASAYFHIDRYERLTDLEGPDFEEGGFSFYPMSVWKQLRSIVIYHWCSLLCQIGLKNPIYRPGIIRTIHAGHSALSE